MSTLSAASRCAPRWSAGRTLPPPVHPVPLLRVTQNQVFQRGIVGPGVAANFLADIGAGNGRERFFETQHVRAVVLAPARGGQHVRIGRERDQREALEGPRRVADAG